MHKLKAFFGGLVQPKTSEFWFLWGTAIVSTVNHFYPQAATVLDAAASWCGIVPPNGSMLVATILSAGVTYAVGRMTSKAAKAQPSQAALDAAAARKD